MPLRLSVIFNGRNDGLKKSARESESILTSMKRTAVGVSAAIGGAYAAIGSVATMVDVTKRYQRLEAQLLTATGSAQGQVAAFAALNEFANQTGQSIESVTEGFTKLVNLGLNPSQEALLAYANVAAGTGKTTMDFVEAVADAATAEFERLKEFGIKAKNQGDTIAFTFRGMTTEVANNANAIEQYLIGLGQNEFGGAVANQAKTLEAALGRAGSAWDDFIYAISEAGAGDAIRGTVEVATAALNELTGLLDSGQLSAVLSAWVGQFPIAFGAVGESVEGLVDTFRDEFGAIGGFLLSAIQQFPANITAMVQILTVELAAMVDIGKAYGVAFAEAVQAELVALLEKVKAFAAEAKDKLQFWDGDTFNFDQAIAAANDRASASTTAAFAQAEAAANRAKDARLSTITAILAERDATLNSYDEQIEKARQLRAEYNQNKASLAATDLGQFSKAATPQTQDERPVSNDFLKLQQQLLSEEEALNASYQRRRDIILNNTEANSQAQQDLLARLNEQYSQDMLGPTQPIDGYQAEIDQIQLEFEAKRAAVLANTALLEQEKTALIERLTQQRNDRVKKLEAAQVSMTLGNYGRLFGGMADMAKAFGGEQSKAYKTMFAISKAFSIAQSIVAIQTGIAQAAALPFPANLGAMATVAAETASIVSTIKGTQMQGQAHDGIAKVPQSNEGTWMLKRGEMVLNNQQRDNFEYLLDYAKQGGGGGNAGSSVIHIHNKIDIDARGAAAGTEEGISQAMDAATQRIKAELAEDFSSGGPLAQRLRSGGIAA